ncbi:MAG: phage tail tape measure protein [Bacteroidales bacterium]|nr:phage tail tape measure protein [Bacteroidales bacterium]
MNNDRGRLEFEMLLNNKRFQQDLQRSKGLIQNFGNSVSAQGKRIDNEFDRMGNSIKSGIEKAVGGAKSAVLDLTKSMLGLSAVMGSGAMLKGMYDDAKEFSRQMRIVSTISEEVSNDLQRFKGAVLDICSQIAIAPATAAEALYQINSAGHLGAAGLDVLEASAKAAVAGVTETSTAADAITTVLNAYGMASTQATAISDKLFTTVRLGKTTMGELGHSISQVAPVAATFGISIDEVLAVVSELTKQGVPTATAMTQIRSAITAVTESLGDGAFATRTLLEAFQEVNEKSKGSENALKTDLGNIRALQAVLMATGQHADETAQFIDEIANSTGATEVAFQKMNTTAGAQLTILKNNFLKEFQEMGDGMTSTLGGIATTLNGMFDSGAMSVMISTLSKLVIAYGVYKVTTVAVHKANSIMYKEQLADLQAVLVKKDAEIAADLQAAVAKGKYTLAQAEEIQATRLEVQEKIKGLAITAEQTRKEAKLATARRMRFQAEVSSTQAEILAKEEEIAACEAYGFTQTAEGLRTERNILQKRLQVLQGKLNIATRLEETKVTKAAAAAQAYDTARTQADVAMKKQYVTWTSVCTAVTKGFRKALEGLKAAFATNPLGMAILGITLVASALTSFSDSVDTASADVERFGKKTADEIADFETLIAVIKATSETSKVHKDAVEEVCKRYDEYNIYIDKTKDITQQLIDKKEEYIRLLKEESEEVKKANILASYQDAYEAAGKSMTGSLSKMFNDEWNGIFESYFNKGEAARAQLTIKENAEQVTAIVSSVVKSTDNSADALERIKQTLIDTYEIPPQVLDHFSDDFVEILDTFYEKTDKLKEGQERVANSMKKTSSAQTEQTVITYSETDSFKKLFDAVHDTKKETEGLSKTKGKVNVDKTTVDEAMEQVKTLAQELTSINDLQITIPEIDTMNLETVAHLIAGITGGLMGGLKGLVTPIDALNSKVATAMLTRGGTDKLIKEVNEYLETVTTGSKEEADALAILAKLNAQKKKFDAMDGKGQKGKTAAETAFEVEKAQLETDKVLKENAEATQKLRNSLAHEQEQNEIKLTDNHFEVKMRQLQLDQAKENEELDQRLKDAIRAEKERQKKFFDAQEKEKKAANQHYAVRNFTEEDVDQGAVQAIIDEYTEIQKQTAALQAKQRQDLFREELQELNSYLQEYGTYQQQRLAIAEEYAEKIRKAQSLGERMRYEKEMSSKIAENKSSEISANIDWTGVFEGLGSVFHDTLAPVLADAKAFTKSDDFKRAGTSQQQAILQSISQMENALGQANKVSFKKLGDETQKYLKIQEKLRIAQTMQTASSDELKDATDAYNDALTGGTKDEQDNAKKRRDAAQIAYSTSQETVETLQAEATKTQQVITQTATNLQDGMDEVYSGMQGLASGGVASAYNGLIDLGKGMQKIKDFGDVGETMGKFADKLKNIPIVGWIASIIDLFKDGISVLIEGIGGAIFNAISGIISDVLTGDLFVTLFETISEGLEKVLDSITYGGFSSLFGADGNADEVNKLIEKNNESIEKLDTSINALTESIEDAKGGFAAVVDAESAIRAAERKTELTRENLKARMGYHAAHHSNAYYWDLGARDYASINATLRDRGYEGEASVYSLEDLLNLSPEALDAIRDYNPDMWAKMLEQGKYNWDDYWEALADCGGAVDEIKDKIHEITTQTSFDSLRDSFMSALLDMDKGVSDFADNFSEYMMKAVLNAKMAELLDDKLEKFYEEWAKRAEDEEGLTSDDIAYLQTMYNDIVDSGLQLRDEVASLTGYDQTTSQSSTSKGLTGMTQDTAEELNGRFTAIQIDTSVIRETCAGINESMQAVMATANESKSVLNEVRDLSLLSIGHLESISKNTHELYGISDLLTKIERKTREM